jgi:hypothetical protein
MQASFNVTLIAAALTLLMSGAGSQLKGQGRSSGPAPEIELLVGTADNCNAGTVTTDRNFLNCGTDPIGWSVRDGSADTTERLYVGVTANVNAGVVSTDPGFRGGATKPVGSVTTSKYGGRQLYVGTVPNCNQGEVTTNNRHKGCDTREIGYTYQKR